MQVVVPQGTYFIMVDWSQLGKCQRNINRIILLQFICFSPPLSDVKIDLSQEQDQQKDFRFTKWMIKNIGFAAIPPSVFYSEEHESEIENYIRCCFFKEDDKLQKADRILTNWVKKWEENQFDWLFSIQRRQFATKNRGSGSCDNTITINKVASDISNSVAIIAIMHKFMNKSQTNCQMCRTPLSSRNCRTHSLFYFHKKLSSFTFNSLSKIESDFI